MFGQLVNVLGKGVKLIDKSLEFMGPVVVEEGVKFYAKRLKDLFENEFSEQKKKN